jgi:hypothetical protein
MADKRAAAAARAVRREIGMSAPVAQVSVRARGGDKAFTQRNHCARLDKV